MQPPPQLPVSAQLDENVFVQRQADEVKGLLDRIAIVGVGHCCFRAGFDLLFCFGEYEFGAADGGVDR